MEWVLYIYKVEKKLNTDRSLDLIYPFAFANGQLDAPKCRILDFFFFFYSSMHVAFAY